MISFWIPHVRYVIRYFSFSVWLTSLGMTISRSIHVANDIIENFSELDSVMHIHCILRRVSQCYLIKYYLSSGTEALQFMNCYFIQLWWEAWSYGPEQSVLPPGTLIAQPVSLRVWEEMAFWIDLDFKLSGDRASLSPHLCRCSPGALEQMREVVSPSPASPPHHPLTMHDAGRPCALPGPSCLYAQWTLAALPVREEVVW